MYLFMANYQQLAQKEKNSSSGYFPAVSEELKSPANL